MAAKQVLSEMTVADIRNNPVIAYEDDCVTRLIQDDVNETAYNQIKNWSISELREYVLSDETSVDDIAFTRKGLTSEVVAAVAKICSNADLIYGAKKMPVIKKANVDSICQCNTPFNYLFRCFELQCLSRSVV